jgi:hypothetical protein
MLIDDVKVVIFAFVLMQCGVLKSLDDYRRKVENNPHGELSPLPVIDVFSCKAGTGSTAFRPHTDGGTYTFIITFPSVDYQEG